MQIIYYNNQLKQWELNTDKITYTQHGESNLIAYEHNLQWWEDFVQKWSHTTIDSIEELQFTTEQLVRLEHIKYLPEDFGHVYSHYVETGEIHEDTDNLSPSHPFHVIALKHKEVLDLQNKSTDLELEMSRNSAELFETMVMFMGGM